MQALIKFGEKIRRASGNPVRVVVATSASAQIFFRSVFFAGGVFRSVAECQSSRSEEMSLEMKPKLRVRSPNQPTIEEEEEDASAQGKKCFLYCLLVIRDRIWLFNSNPPYYI